MVNIYYYDSLIRKANISYYHHKTKESRKYYEEAVYVIQRLLKKYPRRKKLWFDLGYALYGIRQYKDCLRAYEKCINLGKSYFTSRAYYNRGLCFIKLNDYNSAIHAFENILRQGNLDSDNDQIENVLWWIAELYGKLKDYPNSIKFYKQLIRKERKGMYYYELARVYVKSNDINNAKRALKTCIRLDKKTSYYHDKAMSDKLLNKLI